MPGWTTLSYAISIGYMSSVVPGAQSMENYFARLDWVIRFLWYRARGQCGKNFACAILARAGAGQNFATPDWVTRFLWYLVHAVWRNFAFANVARAARRRNLQR